MREIRRNGSIFLLGDNSVFFVMILLHLVGGEFRRAGQRNSELERAGPTAASRYHGRAFVPNISFGPEVGACCVADKMFLKPIDVFKPEILLEPFAKFGIDLIRFTSNSVNDHAAALENPLLAGRSLAINPPTISMVHLLKQIDLLLIMTVNPVRWPAFIAKRCQRFQQADAWR